MTISKYQEIYLSSAQSALGDAFDYAVNSYHISGDDFVKMFIVSSVSKKMERGEASYLTGKSGIEIVMDIIYETIREVNAEVDETKLSLAITNLVENSIKYNTEGGSVRVSLDADHKFFYIKVSDTGIGIPESEYESIFERFYRVDKARSRSTGGTGLGLSITKNIILKHKGIIKVSSKEEEGSTFTVRIPLNYIVENRIEK